MFQSTKVRFNRQKRISGDCIICATRPALYFNQLNVCPATFYCNHSIPPSRPHFTLSKIYKFLNISCCLILIIGIINDFQQFRGNPPTKQLILLFESLFGVSTIMVNTLCLLRNQIKIQEFHGLISLINRKAFFGVTEVLKPTSAGKIYDTLLFFILIIVFEEVATGLRAAFGEELEFVFLLRMFATEIIILCNVSIGLYVVQVLNLYDSMFENCYEELRRCLYGKKDTRRVVKLQKLQRFYMCLRRNFKLNETFVRSGAIIIYTIDVCLLLIGFSYLLVLHIEHELNLLTFDLYLTAKSMALVVMFSVFCYEAQRILITTKNTVSSLFQCSMSQLSSVESAQVELIIQTLTVLKPDLNASDIFTVDTGLVASVGGTAVTYALVALQFRALLSAD